MLKHIAVTCVTMIGEDCKKWEEPFISLFHQQTLIKIQSALRDTAPLFATPTPLLLFCRWKQRRGALGSAVKIKKIKMLWIFCCPIAMCIDVRGGKVCLFFATSLLLYYPKRMWHFHQLKISALRFGYLLVKKTKVGNLPLFPQPTLSPPQSMMTTFDL